MIIVPEKFSKALQRAKVEEVKDNQGDEGDQPAR